MLFSMTFQQYIALTLAAFATTSLVSAIPVTDIDTDRSHMEARTVQEFLGYTGTETGQAKLYESGQLVKVVSSGRGSNLGDGIYLSDTLSSVSKFAESAAQNQKSSPMVCYFWATDQTHWRNLVKKVWIPSTAWGAGKESVRDQLAGGASQPYVRIAELPAGGNQMTLPTGTTSNIVVKCVPAAQAQEQVKGFSYKAMLLLWKVQNLSKAQKITAYSAQQKYLEAQGQETVKST